MSTAMNTAPPRAVPAASARSTLWQPATAAACQGCDELALTLLDVLDYMEGSAHRCTALQTDRRQHDRPASPWARRLDDAQPVCQDCARLALRHHRCVRRYEDLPQAAQQLCHTSGGAGRLQDQVHLRRPRARCLHHAEVIFLLASRHPPRGGKNLYNGRPQKADPYKVCLWVFRIQRPRGNFPN